MTRFATAVLAVTLSLGLAGCDQNAKMAQEHRAKGNAARKEKKDAEAAVEFGKSYELKPTQDKVDKLLDLKAQSEVQAGNYDAAAETLKIPLKTAADDAAKIAVYMKIGNMYLKTPDITKAEPYFHEVLKI